jgi:hypothetical protein
VGALPENFDDYVTKFLLWRTKRMTTAKDTSRRHRQHRRKAMIKRGFA